MSCVGLFGSDGGKDHYFCKSILRYYIRNVEVEAGDHVKNIRAEVRHIQHGALVIPERSRRFTESIQIWIVAELEDVCLSRVAKWSAPVS